MEKWRCRGGVEEQEGSMAGVREAKTELEVGGAREEVGERGAGNIPANKQGKTSESNKKRKQNRVKWLPIRQNSKD